MNLYDARADELLRAHGLRRTPGRISLLRLLAAQKRPVTIEYLQERTGSEFDFTTIYRALEAFTERGMVVRYDFGHGHAHYELAHTKPHHHHVVCESCGKIEDVPANDSSQLTAHALRHSPGFTRINRHSLEFFGMCASCT